MNCKLDTRAADSRQAETDKLVETFARKDRKLDARAAKRKRKTPPIPYAVLRLRNIEKFMDDLYGSVLPEGDDGALVDLGILIATVKVAGKPAINFVRKWAPRMSQEEADRFIAGVDMNLAFLDADELGRRMGVNFLTKDRLKTRTIGSYDVPKAERAKIYRARAEAKRRVKAAAKPVPLTPREQAVILMVGSMLNMSDLARKAARHPLFRDLENVPHAVRRVVKKLVKSGHLGSRLEPRRERSRREYFIWNEHRAKTKESQQNRSNAESAPPKTPIFIGSNGGAKSCVRTPKEIDETGRRESMDRIDLRPSERAPLGRSNQISMVEGTYA